MSGLERPLRNDNETVSAPPPKTDGEWIAFIKLQREQAIRQLRFCDDILVARGELRAYTLARRVR